LIVLEIMHERGEEWMNIEKDAWWRLKRKKKKE